MPIERVHEIFRMPYWPPKRLKSGSSVELGGERTVEVLGDEKVKITFNHGCGTYPTSWELTEGSHINSSMKRWGVPIRWRER